MQSEAPDAKFTILTTQVSTVPGRTITLAAFSAKISDIASTMSSSEVEKAPNNKSPEPTAPSGRGSS